MGNIAGKTKCCGNAGNAIPKLNASPYEYHDRLKELKQNPNLKFLRLFFRVFKLAKRLESLHRNFCALPKIIQELQKFSRENKSMRQLNVMTQSINEIILKIEEFQQIFRSPIMGSIHSAKQFKNRHRQFCGKIAQIFKILKNIQNQDVLGDSSADRYNTSLLACRYIIFILDGQKLKPIQIPAYQDNEKFLNMIEAFGYIRNIFKAVNEIEEDLSKKHQGTVGRSLLMKSQSQLREQSKNIFINRQSYARQMTVVSIKSHIRSFIKAKQKLLNMKREYPDAQYKFPSYESPQNDWTGIHYAFDRKQKRVDLINSLPRQYIIDNYDRNVNFIDYPIIPFEKLYETETIYDYSLFIEVQNEYKQGINQRNQENRVQVNLSVVESTQIEQNEANGQLQPNQREINNSIVLDNNQRQQNNELVNSERFPQVGQIIDQQDEMSNNEDGQNRANSIYSDDLSFLEIFEERDRVHEVKPRTIIKVIF